ncbi:MAG: efflux RND transporter permease subunit, partial [Planctomycetota bacterium]
TSFPDDAEKPVVTDVVVRNLVLNVAVSGKAPERSIKELGERVRKEISRLDGISLVELASVRPWELSIDVSEQTLRQYGLSFADIVRAVQASSLDLPAGSIETSGGRVLIRTTGQARSAAEFERIPLITREDGTRVVLGQVATVRDEFADTDQSARFNGEPAAIAQVYRVADQNALDVANRVHDYVEKARAHMPPGISLTIWRDESTILKSRIDTLRNNGISGLLLVLLTLALFLDLRLALWVSSGIFVAVIGSLMIMPAQHVSINLISLFAFILVLGILVDDAIVVGESIHTAQQSSQSGLEAAIRGVSQVSVPVVFGVLTTIVAFMPALFVPGTSGKIWRVIPVVVIAALTFSLIESMLILPAHLAHKHNRWRVRGIFVVLLILPMWGYVQRAVSAALEWFVQVPYRWLVTLAVRWRYVTLAAGISTLLVSFGLVAGGFVAFEFFPAIEADDVMCTLRMPEGTPVDVTTRAINRIEQAADEVQADLRKKYGVEIFRNRLTNIGEHAQRDRRSAAPTGSHLGSVQIELMSAEQRPIGSRAVSNLWREKIGEIVGADELSFSASLTSVGAPINIQLSGPDVDELAQVAREVRERLGTFTGVFDITDSFEAGKQELRLQLKDGAGNLGLTLFDVAKQVRDGFFGAEIQRIQRGREEVKVMLRYPESQRQSVGSLEQMRIRTADGREVAFSEVATFEHGIGVAAITRVGGDRSVNVTADVTTGAGTSANTVLAAMAATHLPEVLARHPQVRYSLEGQQREQADTMRALGIGFGLALFGIYALLAIPLKSYVQPLVIMISIPFGIIGAIIGHVMCGLTLSMLSVIGIVALAGVVVNSALVLIDFINHHRNPEETDATHAIVNAATSRFRPIMLTSVTTFAGLTPMMLEKSLQAQFLIPMAVSLAFGVLFSTVITLVGIPAAYMVLEDVRRLMANGSRDWRALLGGLVSAPPPAFAHAAPPPPPPPPPPPTPPPAEPGQGSIPRY